MLMLLKNWNKNNVQFEKFTVMEFFETSYPVMFSFLSLFNKKSEIKTRVPKY